MKRINMIILLLLLTCSFMGAQKPLFEKSKNNQGINGFDIEKINILTNKPEVKKYELLNYIGPYLFSTGSTGIFNVFNDDIEFEITVDHGKDIQGVNGYSAILKKGGWAVIAISQGYMSAHVFYKDKIYNITPVSQSVCVVTEINQKYFANENPNDYGSTRTEPVPVTINEPATLTASPVKILVAYTQAVAQTFNNQQAIDDFITLAINTTKGAFTNSYISTQIELAYSTQVSYTESGNSQTDINRFMGTSDSYMDNIHALRSQYEADICILLENTMEPETNGRVNAIPAVASSAFAVVRLSAAVSNYSFPHEIGHLLGTRHDCDTATVPFVYCHGYKGLWKIGGVTGWYRDIMSVDQEDKFPTRIPYFSNPFVLDDNGNPLGTANYNYCASVINQLTSNAADFEGHLSGSILGDQYIPRDQPEIYVCSVNGERPPYSYRWQIYKFSDFAGALPSDCWMDVGSNSYSLFYPLHLGQLRLQFRREAV